VNQHHDTKIGTRHEARADSHQLTAVLLGSNASVFDLVQLLDFHHLHI
jgi:hypothetical protein